MSAEEVKGRPEGDSEKVQPGREGGERRPAPGERRPDRAEGERRGGDRGEDGDRRGDRGRERRGERWNRDRRGPEEAVQAPEAPEPPVPAFSAGELQSKSVNGYVWGTGRRKTAVARVRIKPGDGKFIINKREANDFFKIERDRGHVRQPLTVTQTAGQVDVYVNVGGGGTTGQAGAVALGLARALKRVNGDYDFFLRKHGLLTRDPRKVERKKYGRSGARRRFQFSKR